MAYRLCILIAAALAAGACHGTDAPDRKTGEVVEAAFRQQLTYWLNDGARNVHTVVCFTAEPSVLAPDLSQTDLALVTDAAVRPGSDCEARAGGAVERSTGHPAVLVTAMGVEWIAPDEAWVTLRHYRSEHSLGSQHYRVVREGERWVSLGPILKALPLA